MPSWSYYPVEVNPAGLGADVPAVLVNDALGAGDKLTAGLGLPPLLQIACGIKKEIWWSILNSICQG